MSESSVPGASAQNSYRPFSPEERLGALVHDIVDVMMKLHAEKTNSGQDHPIEPFHGDNRVQADCIRHFRQFEKRVIDLETQLHGFERVVRQLGSSSGLISAANRVRKHLLQIFEVFRSDSASIYSMFSDNAHCEVPDILRPHVPSHFGQMTKFKRDFPDLFKELSEDLDEFLYSLLDIPEFSDKRLPDSISAFQGWLAYRADGLEDFRENLQTPAVRLYTHGLMDEMGKYLKRTEDALESFAKDGVAALRTAQDRSQVQLQNMSTVATFFSAVAATTFQYTTGDNDSTLDHVVRMLWISSLILSIASAINSQLAMHWRAAMYRSPRNALPMWMSLCLNHTPLLFLVFSVLTFSIGLVGYTYSSSQGKLVTISATVLTSITSIILLLVVCWEARERWRVSGSSRRSGGDDMGTYRDHRKWRTYPANENILSQSKGAIVQGIRRSYLALCPAFSWFSSNPSSDRRSETAEDLESKAPTNESLGSISASNAVPFSMTVAEHASQPSQEAEELPKAADGSGESTQPKLQIQTSWAPHSASYNHPLSPSGLGGPFLMMGRAFYNRAWQLVRNPDSRKHLNTLPMSPYGREDLQRLDLAVPLSPLKGRGPVRDLRFSPNGKWLGASFTDGTIGVWQVASDTFIWYTSFAARPGPIVWSPDSQFLLVKADGGLMIWQPGANPHFRPSKQGFEAFTWLSDSQHFAAAAGQYVWIMAKATGAVKSRHSLHSNPLRVHDMASVTGGGDGKAGLLVIVCSMKEEPWSQELHEGFISLFGPRWHRVRPKNVEPQRRIIVYDINRGKVVAAVPVRGEAQQVTVSRNGKFALISYGPSTPPELWHIEISKNGDVFLELCHMYLHNTNPRDGAGPTDFVGQARFGGDCDEYVVAVTKSGEVYVWDCLSSHLCHHVKDIRGPGALREAVAIAWCPTNEERKIPLFACGIDDGSLVIWRGSDAEPCPGFPTPPPLSGTPISAGSGNGSVEESSNGINVEK